jgi:hypothetical protein
MQPLPVRNSAPIPPCLAWLAPPFGRTPTPAHSYDLLRFAQLVSTYHHIPFQLLPFPLGLADERSRRHTKARAKRACYRRAEGTIPAEYHSHRAFWGILPKDPRFLASLGARCPGWAGEAYAAEGLDAFGLI